MVNPATFTLGPDTFLLCYLRILIRVVERAIEDWCSRHSRHIKKGHAEYRRGTSEAMLTTKPQQENSLGSIDSHELRCTAHGTSLCTRAVRRRERAEVKKRASSSPLDKYGFRRNPGWVGNQRPHFQRSLSGWPVVAAHSRVRTILCWGVANGFWVSTSLCPARQGVMRVADRGKSRASSYQPTHPWSFFTVSRTVRRCGLAMGESGAWDGFGFKARILS